MDWTLPHTHQNYEADLTLSPPCVMEWAFMHRVNLPSPQTFLENQVCVDLGGRRIIKKKTMIFHQAAGLRPQPRREHNVLVIPTQAIKEWTFVRVNSNSTSFNLSVSQTNCHDCIVYLKLKKTSVKQMTKYGIET
jgi:hypothetical protein